MSAETTEPMSGHRHPILRVMEIVSEVHATLIAENMHGSAARLRDALAVADKVLALDSQTKR